MRKIYPDFPYTPIQLEWIKVLQGKSGSFKPKQTKYALKRAYKDNQEEFCCLGVGAEIAIDNGAVDGAWSVGCDSVKCVWSAGPDGTGDWDDQVDLYALDVEFETGDTEVLPESFGDALGLRNSDGSAIDIARGEDDYFCPEALFELNDGCSLSFTDIATMIRMFPHFYFKNGGAPSIDVYREDIFLDGFDPLFHRAQYFERT